ncbi:hypothetical protein GGQ76_000663 [Aureimonas jatrophae]|uniref:Ankyrin repeat domain-containing protein n=1 Tax=Aureimonas jatrophae TaxID=1166073 RepID=A0A1H0CX55_9HYPH|nr:hypothetical protein [Aureimonas jatrophae]MBB3949395.1 hypothetical protein [Aureimonas jatrophae]SDN62459.1 hypothetical protein SAMN05192530_101499 [Aureimonas jatrophae]
MTLISRLGPPLAFALVCLGASSPASAFSQIPDDANPAPAREGIVTVPLPPVPGGTPSATPPAPAAPAGAETVPPAAAPGDAAPENAAPSVEPDPDADDAAPQAPVDVPPARILYNEDELPVPVRDLRRKLIEIAKSGDVEKLRPYIQTGADPTTLSLVDDGTDPIQILKDASGDGNGVELLAILLETLEAGHVHVEGDGADEIFVWPYFTQVDLSKLTNPQLVELFELVTAGDYQRMLANGSYDFYRLGISPEGRFEFFVAGD